MMTPAAKDDTQAHVMAAPTAWPPIDRLPGLSSRPRLSCRETDWRSMRVASGVFAILVAAVASASCGPSPQTVVVAEQKAPLVLQDLQGQGLYLDPNGFEGRICIGDVCQVGAAPKRYDLAPGQYNIASHESLELGGGWNPSLGVLTVDSSGAATVTSTHFVTGTVEGSSNAIQLQTTPFVLNNRGYIGYFTFDFIKVWTTGFSTRLIADRRYTLFDIASSNRPEGGNYALSNSGVDIIIRSEGETSDVTGETLQSFDWNAPAHTLTARTQEVALDFHGYRGAMGFGDQPGMYQHSPAGGVATYVLLRNRHYGMLDFGSANPATMAANFTSTYGLKVEADGSLVVAPDLAQYFQPVGGARLKSNVGTITATSVGLSGYFHTGGGNGFQLGAPGTVTAVMMKGRKYGLAPNYVTFEFAFDGTTTPSFFELAWGGTLQFVSTAGTAPEAPSNLVITAESGSTLQATWTDNSGGTAGFVLERSKVPGPSFDWSPVATIAAGTTTFTDQGLEPSTSYHYRIGAVDTTFPTPTSWVGAVSGTTLAACVGETQSHVKCGGDLCHPMICVAGACVPGPEVTCTAPDQCHPAGVCDPANGQCSTPPVPDGQGCSGGNPCDGPNSNGAACAGNGNCSVGVCQDGACVLANPAACTVAVTEGACDDTIADPVSAAATAAAVQAFSWASTQPLVPTDPIGRQALYYARIYVHGREQQENLDTFLIHHSVLPIFADPSLPTSACGAYTPTGDGTGGFVYAIIPADTYNALRDAAITVDPTVGTVTPFFDVINVLPIPLEARNTSGSISYDYLQQSDFRFRNGATVPGDNQMPLSFSGAWNAVKNKIVGTAKAAAQKVNDAIGYLDRKLLGTAKVTIALHVANLDPRFGDTNEPMTRAWGPHAGEELGLRNVTVNLAYPSPVGLLLGGVTGYTGVVVPHSGKTDASGRVVIEVPKHLPLLWFSISKENEAGRVYSNPVFTQVHLNFGNYPQLSFLSGDTSIEFLTKDEQLAELAQVTDGYDYVKTVTGQAPYRANIVTGKVTIPFSPSGRSYTPCFGLPNPNLTKDAIRLILDGDSLGSLIGSGEVLDMLSDADMVLTKNAGKDRETVTHEYGHFALCSMLYQESEWDALLGLSQLTWSFVSGGITQGREDEEAILNEAFADFFDGQLAGARDYAYLGEDKFYSATQDSSGRLSGTGFERNYSNRYATSGDTKADFIERHYWAMSVMHDAFDGHDTGTSPMTDGDPWFTPFGGSLLTYTPVRWGDSCGKGLLRNEQNCDERVALGGDQLRNWIANWASRGHSLSYSNFMGGLGDTMRNAGINWCQRCELFAAHTPGLDTIPSPGNPRKPPSDYWNVCASQSDIRDWIGAPPVESLAINAPDCTLCPPGTISPPGSPTGACVACPPGGVASGNTCVFCAANEVAYGGVCEACVNSTGPLNNRCVCQLHSRSDSRGINCVACGPGEIVGASGNCEACPSNRSPSIVTETCDACYNGCGSGGKVPVDPSLVAFGCDIDRGCVCVTPAECVADPSRTYTAACGGRCLGSP